MSAAEAETVEPDGQAPELPKKGKKKLIIIIAAAVLVTAGVGGGATVFVKKRRAAAEAAAAAAAADGDGEETAAASVARAAPKEKRHHDGPPVFLPLDPFVVNLSDRDSERFAQIGITLEINDAKFGDQLKAYMPAIRNGILIAIAGKTAAELLTRAGKEKLAAEVMHEAVRPLGIELDDGSEPSAAAAGSEEEKLIKTPLDDSPVRRVHFSSFIIQ